MLPIAIVALVLAAPAVAPSGRFYQGKTIRMLVGSAPGGGYDTYARTFVQYLRKHIPGRADDRGAEHAGRRRAWW